MPAYGTVETSKRGIALLRAKHYYILYDAKSMIDYLRTLPLCKLTPQRRSQLKHYVIGAVTVSRGNKSRGWGASQVTTSATQPGFGPMLYDIVMAFEDGLFPDRDDVSPSARKVWKFYKEKRSDVVAKPLDDINHPKTLTLFDDALVYNGGQKNPLNYAYMINKMPNVSQLLLNNDLAMASFENWDISEFDLLRLADEFFLDKYDQENT